MARFTVYFYTHRMGSLSRELLTFRGEPGFHEAGHVTGPDGSSIYAPRGGDLKLKIPKPNNRDESWLYDVRDAVRAAQAGEDGLSWHPAVAATPSGTATAQKVTT